VSPLPWVTVLDAVAELAATRDLVLVEGAGGLLVHLDGDKQTIVDVAVGLSADVLMVSSAGLGALNAVALTAEAMQTRGASCAGVVIGSWPIAPDLASLCNVNDFEDYAGVPLVGALPERAGELEPMDFLRVARASLAPRLGGTWDADAFRHAARVTAG
jgi:dethiobiotin synthetase